MRRHARRTCRRVGGSCIVGADRCRSAVASLLNNAAAPRGQVTDQPAPPGSRPSSTTMRSRAFSAARCAAPPTRTWAVSSTSWSTAAGRCAPRSSTSAAFSASAAARSRSIGTRCTFRAPAQAEAPITLELTRDQVKAAPEYQEGKPVVVLGALGKLEPLPSNNQSTFAGEATCPANHHGALRRPDRTTRCASEALPAAACRRRPAAAGS